MMTQVRVGALVVLGAALASLPTVARAQDSSAPSPPVKTTQALPRSTVATGYIRSINAGVIAMIDGSIVFVTSQTKFPDGKPTIISQIRVTGTRAAQANIDATEIDIIK